MCLGTSRMLGMDSTPGSTIPEKCIEVGSTIEDAEHDLIGTSCWIASKSNPVIYTSSLSIIEQRGSTQSGT